MESEIHNIAKWGIAKAFMEKGYMAGVEISEDGSRFDVKVTKRERTYVFEIYVSHLSELWKNHAEENIQTSEQNEVLTPTGIRRPEWMNYETLVNMMEEQLCVRDDMGYRIVDFKSKNHHVNCG